MHDDYQTQPMRQFQQHPGKLSRVEANSLKMKAVSKNEPPTTILPRLPAHLQETWKTPIVHVRRRKHSLDVWTIALIGELIVCAIMIAAVLWMWR
jgi:hypothetical protein